MMAESEENWDICCPVRISRHETPSEVWHEVRVAPGNPAYRRTTNYPDAVWYGPLLTKLPPCDLPKEPTQ